MPPGLNNTCCCLNDADWEKYVQTGKVMKKEKKKQEKAETPAYHTRPVFPQ